MENDFDIRRDILLKYKGSEKDVIIPDGVTAIDEKAFRGCETLESVVIPDTVISIRWGSIFILQKSQEDNDTVLCRVHLRIGYRGVYESY